MSLHGISRDAWNRYAASGSWYYEIEDAGFKYNMTDLAAALGLGPARRGRRSSLRLAERWLDATRARIGELRCRRPGRDPARRAGWLPRLAPVRHPARARTGCGSIAAAVIDGLKALGIGTSVHFIPLHLHPYYRDRWGYRAERLPGRDRGVRARDLAADLAGHDRRRYRSCRRRRWNRSWGMLEASRRRAPTPSDTVCAVAARVFIRRVLWLLSSQVSGPAVRCRGDRGRHRHKALVVAESRDAARGGVTRSGSRPMVSLLVAMRNEEGFIGTTLGSIFAQDYPSDLLEVRVYDGDSTDRSWDIAEALCATRGPGVGLQESADHAGRRVESRDRRGPRRDPGHRECAL